MDHRLRAELLRRGAQDRRARTRWLGHREDWNVVQRLDADNTAWLAEIIAAHGWPGHALVGTDGAHAAWLLAQHATPQHQVCWLNLLREAVEHGDAQARDLAYLEDRVQLHQGLPQRYGTQWIGISEHASRLAPLTEPAEVNARRADVGLPSIDEHDLDNAWHFDQLRGLRPRKA